MYNLQRYSTVLLVLLLHFKTFTALPYDVHPIPIEVPQASPNLEVQLKDAALSSRSADLNQTNTYPNTRNAFETVHSANVSFDMVASRSLPLPAQAPEASPVFADVAPRSALSLDPQPNTYEPVQRSVFRVEQPLNASLVSNPEPVYRSGLETLASTPNNTNNVEPRFLNVSLVAEISPRVANESQIDVRSADLHPATNQTAVPSNAFNPSFLNNFEQRKKRDEVPGTVTSGNHSTAPEVNFRSSFEQATLGDKVESSLASANVEAPDEPTAELSLRSDVEQVEAEPVAAEVNVAPYSANLRSGLELLSSAVHIPYITVYPVGKIDV